MTISRRRGKLRNHVFLKLEDVILSVKTNPFSPTPHVVKRGVDQMGAVRHQQALHIKPDLRACGVVGGSLEGHAWMEESPGVEIFNLHPGPLGIQVGLG